MNLAVIIAFWSFIAAIIVALLTFVSHTIAKKRRRGRSYDLSRHHANPVLSPQQHREWEAEGTFNPGAVEDSRGIIHLFYRAIGRGGLSKIGHSSSVGGKIFDERSSYPVYDPLPGYGAPRDIAERSKTHGYDIVANPSGGGWGGAEDPRTTKIGDRVYMTYTAFGGWTDMRIGVTSIAVKDMEEGNWKWKKPVLISPPGVRAKNWVFFPEKIGGKYAILHGLVPRVMVAYVDSPEMVPDVKSIKDHGGYGLQDNSRDGFWDKKMKGAGTPPIKTDAGWLVLYHAIDDNKYKVGAMLLDLRDPTQIRYRSPEPILSPDMAYENDGKPGVVYATGAVVKDGKLLVYYGGGDKHTCVAETPLRPLLDWLVQYGEV